MGLVEDADRDQEQTALGLQVIADIVFDVGLFQFDLTRLAVTGECVFKLELGPKTQLLGKFIAKEQHETVEIDLILVVNAVVVDIVVVKLTVSTDAHTVCPAALIRVRGDCFLDGNHGGLGLFISLGGLLGGVLLLLFQCLDLGLLLLDDLPQFLNGRRGLVGCD